MHAYRNPQHTAKRNQLAADMAVYPCAVIRAPIGHYRIYIGKRAFSRKPGGKPCGRPGRIGTSVQQLMRFLIQHTGITLGDLHHGTSPVYQTKPCHRHRHFRQRFKMAGITAAAEIFIICPAPIAAFKAGRNIRLGHIPPFLHTPGARFISGGAGCIQRSSTGINQMHESIPGISLKPGSRHALHCLWRPVGAHIRKQRRFAS